MDYDALEKRLREPPFGTETSERNLMMAAADAIADLRARNAALCDIIFRYVDPCDVLPEDDTVVAEAIAANREG